MLSRLHLVGQRPQACLKGEAPDVMWGEAGIGGPELQEKGAGSAEDVCVRRSEFKSGTYEERRDAMSLHLP
ncbi:hypothetical protein GCM10008949_44640 [Deinococcus humi]|nr:hypothetical protein GCM10008949_44640 [Deinococcus humi]